MKKLLTVTAFLAALLSGVSARAQFLDGPRVGLIGGFTSSSPDVRHFDASTVSQYHAGLTFQVPVGAGFAIQPSILYQVKGASLDKAASSSLDVTIKSFDMKVGFVEVPIQLQWGPDMLAFRPYLFAEPFVGVGVTLDSEAKEVVVDGHALGKDSKSDFKKAALNRLEYGLGFGVGLEFWKLQLSGKYYWNLGDLYEEGDSAKDVTNGVAQTVKAAFKDKKSFSGFTVSLALFF